MRACLCFAAMLSLQICTRAGDVRAAEGEQANYLPLKQGTKWLFDCKVNGIPASMTIRIANLQSGPGRQAAELESVVGGKVMATEYLGVSEEGIFRLKMNGHDVNPPLPILRFPVTKGDAWNCEESIAGESLKASSVVDLQQVTVPAGTFDAAVVTTHGKTAQGTLVNKQWFVPGIGPVKQEVQMSGASITAELKKYEPAK
jgi:hypothetical protein